MNPTCSVLCSVQNGREVTLSWEREGETLNHTSSPDLSTLLSLSLEIEYNSAPYSCVMNNPVSNQTVTVKPEEYCFDPVSRPQVSSRNKVNPTCSVLCSVQNGREVTLSWQREGETLNQTSSPDFSTLLSLSLEIEYNSAPYSCVMNNPVSNQTVTVKPEEYCFGASNDLVYGNINHQRSRRQEAAARRANQAAAEVAGESPRPLPPRDSLGAPGGDRRRTPRRRRAPPHLRDFVLDNGVTGDD
ncbi:hypothetical protein AAFF_G00433690 [Aldrovandia affinis]|uniref:Ig-like domain-containing protein n=1 Tax=Aldrovandia affinis TaxID=143900 RepID=A0AAD7VY44_9TELE|nr:hypothetical protein AAFF_G00433690 [Aldrovandia affinis]